MTVTRPCGPHVGIDAAEAGIPCPVCGLGTPTPADTDWLDQLEKAAHAAVLNFVPVRPATVLHLIAEVRDLSERLAQAYRDEVLAHDERDVLAAKVAAVEALLAEGPDTWEGFDTRDIGHAFVADAVTDFTADLRAALEGGER